MKRTKRAKPRAPKNKKRSTAPDPAKLNLRRTGMPARDSITSITEFPHQRYRIIQTNEIDEYEQTNTVRKRKQP